MTGMEPGGFYWAVEKHEDTRATIVHVSTVFGEDPEYWTLAVIGSEQHRMPDEFVIISRIECDHPEVRARNVGPTV
jgi:hypothetical protein